MKDMKNMKRKNSIVFTWQVSYIIMLLLPLLLGFFSYNHIEKMVSAEVRNANAIAVTNSMQNADRIVGNINKFNMQLSFSRAVSDFFDIKPPLTPAERFASLDVNSELRVVQNSDSDLKYIYIYFPALDCVITPLSLIESRDFYTASHNNSESDFEEWKQFLSSITTSAQVKTKMSFGFDSPEQEFVAFIQPLPLVTRDTQAVSVILVSPESFLNALNVGNTYGASNVIFDNNGGALVSSSEWEIEKPASDGESGIFETKTIDGKKASAFYLKSETLGWTYVSVVPDESYLRPLWDMRIWLAVFSALYIFLGIFSIWFLIRRNYSPVKAILDTIESRLPSMTSERTNEYGLIEQILNRMFSENDKMSKIVDAQTDTVKQSFLNRLLYGDIPKKSIHDELARYEIATISEFFTTILFYIKDTGDILTEGHEENYRENFKQAGFVINNVMKELLGKDNFVISTEINNQPCIILNIRPENIERVYDQLITAVDYGADIISEHFHVSFIAAVGEIQFSADGIPIAYQEAQMAAEYGLLRNKGRTIFHKDLTSTTKTDYSYTIETERQLINYIRVGDSCAAKALIDEVFTINFAEKNLILSMAKCLMFDITGTVIKALHSYAPLPHTLQEKINTVTQYENLLSFQGNIRDVIGESCIFMKEKAKDGKDEREKETLKSKIITFIDENYTNQELNVSMIAYSLNLHPTYISNEFKARTGENLLDYIMKYRIQKAIKLFDDENLNLEAIAEATGYGNLRNFVRAFKKYEGVTPAKYREIRQRP